MKTKFFHIALFIYLLFNSLSAQNITIRGKVIDATSSKPLYGVNVYLLGTHIGNATDMEGNYVISSVPEGSWILVCSIIGFIKEEREIIIEKHNNYEINFDLKIDELVFSNVVITATRNEALVTEVPVATEILESDDIARLNAKNAGEALRNIGGLLVKSYGALGSLQSVSLRGSTDQQVLILIDGQKLNNGQQNSVNLSTIPVEIIDRIEVIKGGNSAMYGSDAVGGVINIITRSGVRENQLNFTLGGMYGSFSSRSYDASLRQGIDNFDYFISYNRTESDGDYNYSNLSGERTKLLNNDTRSDNIFIKSGYLFSDQSHLIASYNYRKSDDGSPGSIEYPNLSARNRSNNNRFSFSYEGLTSGAFAFNFNTYLMKREHIYFNPEAFSGTEESIYNNFEFGGIIQVFTDIKEYGLLSYGYEYRNENLKSDQLINKLSVPFIGNHQRDIHSFYFQNDWKYSFDHRWKISLVPAVRLDNYPEPGTESQFSPKLGFSLSHDKKWRGSVRGNIGRVFRAPTYNDLYWPEDTWTKGNPDLKPEKGITYDLGFIVQFAGAGSWSIESTYFGSKLNDLILWASGSDGKWIPSNIARAEINGLESKISWSGFDNYVGLQAAHTYMRSVDDGDNTATKGKFLVYRPENKFDLILNLKYGISSLNLSYNYIGKRFHDEENKILLDSYCVTNANIGVIPKIFNMDCTIMFQINNIENKAIQTVLDSPLPGREIRISLTLKGDITGLN